MRKSLTVCILIAVLVTLVALAVSCSESGVSSVPPPTSNNIGAGMTTAVVIPTTPSATTPTANSSQKPPSVAIISVSGPIPPFNPGGPAVAITLKNVSDKPVVSLNAILELNKSFDFNFDVSSAKPLLPNNLISSKTTLINGGFSDSLFYSLKISGAFQNGSTFGYTDQVKILEPPSATSSFMPTNTATSTPVTFDQNSATATSENGLKLTLSIDSISYQPGDQISVTIDEKNTLTTENKIHVANGWAVQGLNVGPCGTLNYPFGISILQGYYDIKSIVSITPLQLYDPNGKYSCPMMLAGITSYDFQPSSDIAAIYTSYDSEPFSTSMTAKVTSAGFWTGGPKASFINFTCGIYTVVGGDEWGGLTIIRLTIS